MLFLLVECDQRFAKSFWYLYKSSLHNTDKSRLDNPMKFMLCKIEGDPRIGLPICPVLGLITNYYNESMRVFSFATATNPESLTIKIET